MAKHTEGAVHLTSLDLDISQLQENINTIQTELNELADSAVEYGEKIRNSLNFPNEQIGISVDTTKFAQDLNEAQVAMGGFEKATQKTSSNISKMGNAFQEAVKEQEQFFVRAKDANSLAKAYETLQVKIAGVISSLTAYKVKDSGMTDLIAKAKETEQSIIATAAQIRETGNVTEDSYKAFQDFKSVLNEISVAFSHQKTGFNEYKTSLEPIQKTVQSTVASLKTLEKSAVFSTSKKKVAELRAEYEEFLNRLKNTRIGTGEAQEELGKLQTKFEQLESTVKRGNGTLENWVNKISESAKWQIANSALNLLQQSFGQLTTTIIDTENATIELQRVLNDKNLSSSAISDELYQIAYDFGQTFDAVQSTAVKFAQTGMEWTDVVEATRVTMLGLNTAELEVETATQGLIAVMAQFGKDASELESVIDKINITADNFPVTSEKIVAALQRAGGTANAFGLSLEETIGIITALGAATGRAGEAIGTAMNSLISFSMKGSALEKFSDFLGQDVSNFGVLELWQALAEEIEKGNRSLATMMSTSEEFNDLMDEELATSIGLTEEYTKAQEEANKMTAEGKDIYSTVGTYRQNYFIALLNNIGMAIAAIEGMNGAIGYSMQENETAMEAFSRQWNQLVISLQELAIQLGEAGFLQSMKDIVNITTEVVKLTQSFGGLRTAMLAIITIMATLKKNRINGYINDIRESIVNATTATTAAATATNSANTATQALTVTIGTLKLSLGGIVAIASLIATVISAVIGKMQAAKEEANRLREEAIATGQEAVEQSKELYNAYKEYDIAKSGGSREEQEAATENILKLLGYEITDTKILEERYGSLANAIEELMDAQYEANKEAARGAYEAKKSTEEFQEVQRQSIEIAKEDKEVLEELNKAGYDVGNWINALKFNAKDITVAFEIPDFASAQPQLDKYNGMLKVMESLMTSGEKANSKLYQSILKARDALEQYINEVEDLKEKYEQYGMSREEYDRNMAEAEKRFKESIADIQDVAETTVMSLEDMDKAIDNLNKKMDTFQSSVNTVQKIIEEYNQTGIMTADMLQDLIGLAPEYIDLIDQNSGALELNQEKLESLMLANDNYMIQMAAMKVARETEATITELQKQKYDELTASEIVASMTTEALGGAVYEAALQFLTGKTNANQFEDAIRGFGEQAGLSANKLEALGTTIGNLTGKYKDFINVAGMVGNLAVQSSKKIIDGKELYEWQNDRLRGIISEAKFQDILNRANKGLYDDVVSQKPTSSGTKTWFPSTSSSKKASSSGSSKSTSDPYKEEKEALNDLLSSYEHAIFLIEKNEKTSQSSADKIVAIYRKMQSEVHKQAEYYRAQGIDENDEMITKLSEQWWQYQEAIEETLRGVYDATVNTFENAISMLEHQYESAEQRLDYSYMGENLKKQLDYQVKIQKEAERELERLSKKGIDVNDDAAQEVINRWYEAEKAIREISQKIAEDILDPYDDFIDMADKFDIWEYMDFTKVDYLRDKLAAVNKLLQEGTITLKQYNEELKNISYAIFDAQKDLYEQEKADVSERVKATTDAYKAEIDALKNRKDEINDYYDSVIDGYNKEIETWEKRKEEIEDYYDTLIGGLQDVEKANDRINKQLDYYNERQKIITNIEQAQSRSGVEWREKEMEYQQNLIDLDEEWRRTLEEWSIEDQIEAIEKLKEAALADIDLSIQKIRDTITAAEEAKDAALKGIEEQIKGIEDIIEATEQKAEEEIAQIDNKIKDLSKTIADSIKNGTADGLVNSKAELDKALVDGTNAMLEFIDKNQTAAQNSAKATATNAYGIYTQDFLQPMTKGIDEIASHMKNALTSGVAEGAKQALSTLQKELITPLKNEMASVMKQTQSAKATVASVGSSSSGTTTSKKTITSVPSVKSSTDDLWNKLGLKSTLAWDNQPFKFQNPTNHVYITNNNFGIENAANKTAKNLHDILGT